MPPLDRPRPRIQLRHETTQNRAEFLAIAHLRQWCHDTVACPICRAGRTPAEQRQLEASLLRPTN